MPASGQTTIERALKLFREHHGLLRTSEASAPASTPRALRPQGRRGARAPERGLYRLADLPPLGNPDLATVGGAYLRRRLPRLSTAYHGLPPRCPTPSI